MASRSLSCRRGFAAPSAVVRFSRSSRGVRLTSLESRKGGVGKAAKLGATWIGRITLEPGAMSLP